MELAFIRAAPTVQMFACSVPGGRERISNQGGAHRGLATKPPKSPVHNRDPSRRSSNEYRVRPGISKQHRAASLRIYDRLISRCADWQKTRVQRREKPDQTRVRLLHDAPGRYRTGRARQTHRDSARAMGAIRGAKECVRGSGHQQPSGVSEQHADEGGVFRGRRG